MRGVRFNFVKRLVEATPREVYLGIAERVAALGWHIVVYFEAHELADLIPFLQSLPTTIVVDHMGRPDLSKRVDHPDFRRFVDLMAADPRIWSKLACPERLSISGPPTYDDFVPFARELVRSFPDRVLWGADWPHPNMTTPHARRRRSGEHDSADRHDAGRAAGAARRQPDAALLVSMIPNQDGRTHDVRQFLPELPNLGYSFPWSVEAPFARSESRSAAQNNCAKARLSTAGVVDH